MIDERAIEKQSFAVKDEVLLKKLKRERLPERLHLG